RRAGPAAREPLRGVRALRRRADSDLVPRDPAGVGLHPSDGVHERRPADVWLDVPHVLRLVGRSARNGERALSHRADGQAHRRAVAGTEGAVGVTSAEKYVAAAYLVVFLVLLAYIVIIASKLQRLEAALGELVEQVRARG